MKELPYSGGSFFCIIFYSIYLIIEGNLKVTRIK